MPKMSALKKRALDPIPTDDGPLNIVYFRPTAEYSDQVKEALASAETSGKETVARILVPLIAEWDVVDDEGEPLPITVENVMSLPQDILTEIQTRINERENTAKNEQAPSETSS